MTVRGRVVSEGRPLQGVAVSDGRAVTVTGSDGAFELAGAGPFVFVVRPAGMTADPWYRVPGDDLVFDLRPEPASSSFVHVTDLHLSLGDPSFGPDAGDATYYLDGGELRRRVVTTPQVLADLFADIAVVAPGAVVVATGDLTDSGLDPEFEALRGVIDSAPVRVVAMPGNHDQMPADPSEIGDGGYHDFTAVSARYERHFGPRWFSFDLDGVHVVAIDWFTHRLGIDPAEQEAWIAADLAAISKDYILLSHDLMSAAFYARLPRRPLATFSGHWHTSRVIEHDRVPHYNTGPATFGGLDYSPAHMRVVRWRDGIEVRTVARGPAAAASATFAPTRSGGGDHLWLAHAAGAGHMAPPVIAEGTVLVASKHEDRAAGALEAFALEDGTPMWRVSLGSAVKAAPVVAGGLAIVSAVTGETVAVDVATGAERWRTEIADPFRLWCYLRPVSDGRRVFVGDVDRFVALDLQDGSVVWAREDLGTRENGTSIAHPVIVGDRLVVSFIAQVPDLWGLDPATGATRWPLGVEGHSVYRGTQAEIVAALPRTPMAALAPDPDGSDFYVVRLGSVVERVRATDGSPVWSAGFRGWFNPGRPAVTDDAVVVSEGMGWVWSFDRATGQLRWRTEVAAASPLAFGAYRDRGPALLAGPSVAGEGIVVPAGDGSIVTLRAADGSIARRLDVGVPVLARAAVADDRVVVMGADGSVRAVSFDSLGVPDCGVSSLYV